MYQNSYKLRCFWKNENELLSESSSKNLRNVYLWRKESQNVIKYCISGIIIKSKAFPIFKGISYQVEVEQIAIRTRIPSIRGERFSSPCESYEFEIFAEVWLSVKLKVMNLLESLKAQAVWEITYMNRKYSM